jgi:hypothetical protein
MDKNKKITSLLKDSYLAAIKNSVRSKLFRNFYAKIDGKKKDLLRNGELSCAFFVSSILKIFDLISKTHLRVKNVVEDLKKSGWKKIRKPKIGSVIVWERKKFGKKIHRHIGFYIKKNIAISNSYKKKTPIFHHFTFNKKRKIEAIFWHKKLEKMSRLKF